MKTCKTCACSGVVRVPGPVPEEVGEAQPITVPVCRANPPQALLINSQSGPQAITVWPQIIPEVDFCGFHRPVVAEA